MPSSEGDSMFMTVESTYNVYKDKIYHYDGNINNFDVIYDNKGKVINNTFFAMPKEIEFSTDSLEQAIAYLTERENNEPRKL